VSPRRASFVFASAFTLLACVATESRAQDPALQCQKAIEDGGIRYAQRLLREIDRCATAGAASMQTCLDAPATRSRLERNLPRWRERVATACTGVDVHSTLGYLDQCAPHDSPCEFATESVLAEGPRNDLVDCAQCRIDRQLHEVTDRLFAGVGAANGCRARIARPGVDLLEDQLRALTACVRRPDALSLAGCLSEPALQSTLTSAASAWRSAAAQGCPNVDPFSTLGYEPLCTGVEPPTPGFCSEGSPPCTLVAATRLDTTSPNDDLLDCLQCRVDETALAIARDVFGANLCCDEEGCRAVRTRRSCRASGGIPMHYQQSLLPGIPIGFPHGMAIAPDGTIWMPDRIQKTVWEYTPAAELRQWPIYPESPDAMTLDASGVPLLTSRESNVILRLEDGEWSVIALTGEPGHAGDGGPAREALAAAPVGLDFDSRGTLYFTETGLIAFAYQNAGISGEHVRAIDPIGRIRTVAGAGPVGTAGGGGPALLARLASPYGLAVRSDASILIGEAYGERLLDLDPGGLLAHRAGRPGSVLGSFSGDGGPAVLARFNGLEELASDREGNVLVADFRSGRVRLVDRLGSVITILGRDDGVGAFVPLEDGVPASLTWGGCPGGLAVGPDGRVYLGEGQFEVLRVLTRVPY